MFTSFSETLKMYGLNTNIMKIIFVLSAIYILLICSGLLTKTIQNEKHQIILYLVGVILALVEAGVAVVGMCLTVSATYYHASQWGAAYEKLSELERIDLKANVVYSAETYIILFAIIIIAKAIEGTICILKTQYAIESIYNSQEKEKDKYGVVQKKVGRKIQGERSKEICK